MPVDEFERKFLAQRGRSFMPVGTRGRRLLTVTPFAA
jgi:hypothetical protein